jgi:hypothetical protein
MPFIGNTKDVLKMDISNLSTDIAEDLVPDRFHLLLATTS